MNWEYTGDRGYVDIIPTTPAFSPSIDHIAPYFWSHPRIGGGSGPPVLRQAHDLEPAERGRNEPEAFKSGHFSPQYPAFPTSRSQVETNLAAHTQHYSSSTSAQLPPVEHSRQLASTSAGEADSADASTANTSRAQRTPSYSASIPQRTLTFPSTNTIMNDPRRTGHGQQRQVMGPPETPSRVMASPNLYSNLQFSPDLFSVQALGPMMAPPAYPQQRLFWDPSTSAHLQEPQDHYHNPFQNEFDASFESTSNMMPNFTPVTSQEQPYELPVQSQPLHSSYLETSAFPAPFQTSPRVIPPNNENPTLFLSSPARRFGGAEAPSNVFARHHAREVPAYHHQIEESRRERESERQKRRNKAAKRADEELIMSSVKRALSPSKVVRPNLPRSQTSVGNAALHAPLRRRSLASLRDSASASSAASSASSRNGRASPAVNFRTNVTASSLRLKKQKSRLSLAIDDTGIAKTVIEEVPESDDEINMDGNSTEAISSADESEFQTVPSTQNSFCFDNDDDDDSSARYAQPTTTIGSRGLGSSALRRKIGTNRSASSSISTSTNNRREQEETVKPKRHASMHIDPPAEKGDAQKALRAIILDRSRSTSTQEEYSSSRQSDSSVQFHSSPPIQQKPFGTFNRSPTTITDPELATPSTDGDGFGTLGVTRCICTSVSPDGSVMIQCDSCSKWLHSQCLGIDARRIPDVYVCVYCEQTPVKHHSHRGSNIRSGARSGTGVSASPLAHKSTRKPPRNR